MQIVVNTRLLLKNKLDGIGWFTYQTLKRITQGHPDVHFVFLFDQSYDDSFIFSDNVTPLVIGLPARHPFLYYAWFHVSVKSILNKLKPDLFLSPDGFLSPGAKCKQLQVIHDINFFHNPKDLKPLTSTYYNHYFPQYAQLADRIATVSEYSKQDIANSYAIHPSKIDVVYNGINEGFKPMPEAEQQLVRAAYSQNKPYFLFVGSQSPRKNLKRLIAAFDIFKTQTQADVKLVLAGGVYTHENDVIKVIHQSVFKHDVIFTGRLSQPELEKLMASALALTFVPYFEGFGIPLIEAMACETPVMSSNTTCMPEIVGDAALLVNPFSVDEMSGAMIALYQDKALRHQLIERGKQRQAFFSWDKSAKLLWESMSQVL